VAQLPDEEIAQHTRNCTGTPGFIEQDGLDLSSCDVLGAELVSECEQRGSGAMVGIFGDRFEALLAYSLQDASVPVTGPCSRETHEGITAIRNERDLDAQEGARPRHRSTKATMTGSSGPSGSQPSGSSASRKARLAAVVIS
jgi:hypothetical protein